MGDFETLDDWTDEQQQYAAGIVYAPIIIVNFVDFILLHYV